MTDRAASAAGRESALERAVRQGKEFVSTRPLPAATLRKLVSDVAGDPTRAPRGIRLRGVAVTGVLDLSALTLSGDTTLCSLSFEDCFFDLVRLDRGRYKRVSLRGSRIRRLQARDAEFASTIDLRDVQAPETPDPAPLEPRVVGRGRPVAPDECSVDLANCRIDGDVLLARARLKVGLPFGDEISTGPTPYALVLRGADVHGAVRLEPGFVADGGVSIADVHIRGDFRAHGAKLTAVHGAALRAHTARVDGTVFCRDAADRARFEAIGRGQGGLIFQNAQLGRIELHGAVVKAAEPLSEALRAKWEGAVASGKDIEAAHLDDLRADLQGWWRPERSSPTGLALDLSHAVIRAGLIAGSSGRTGDAWPAEFEGVVTARSSQIVGDVVFTGAKLDAGDAHWTAEFVSWAPGLPPVQSYRPAGYALDMRAATVRGLVRMDGGFQADGGVTFADASIQGDVFLFNSVLIAHRRQDISPKSRSAPLALSGRNLLLNGVLRGGGVPRLSSGGGSGDEVPPHFTPLRCHGGVSFANATIDRVDLGGVEIEGGAEGLNFSHSTVRGPFYFNATRKAGSRTDRHRPLLSGPFRMHDAEIRGDLAIDAVLARPTHLDAAGQDQAGRDDFVHFQGDGLKVHGSVSLEQPVVQIGDSAVEHRLLSLKAAQIGRDLSLSYPAGATRLTAEAMAVEGRMSVSGAGGQSVSPRLDARVDLLMPAVRIGQEIRFSDVRLCGCAAKSAVIGGNLTLLGVDLCGPVEFDRAQIQGTVDLNDVVFAQDDRLWLRPDLYQPAPGSDVRDYAGLFLNAATVAGTLRVRDFGRGLDDAGPRRLTSGVIKRSEPGEPEEQNAHFRPDISLSFATAGQLDDLSGAAWAEHVGMILRGFEYRTIFFDEVVAAESPASTWIDSYQTRIRQRLRAYAGDWEMKSYDVILVALAAWLVAVIAFALFGAQGNWLIFLCTALIAAAFPGYLYCRQRYTSYREETMERVRARLFWLDRQYPEGRFKLREYYPQPYTWLARTYRAQGLHSFADTVLIQRCRYDARARRQSLKTLGGEEKAVPRFRKLGAMMARVFDATFRYGMSGTAAAVTCGCYIAFGASVGLVEIEARGLQIATPAGVRCEKISFVVARAVEGLVPRLGEDDQTCGLQMPAASAYTTTNAPTSARPTLSAPPVDAWTLFWGLYRLGGWIILSLTVLTFSGLFRRFAEH